MSWVLAAVKRGHQGLHRAQQLACDMQMHLQGAISILSLLLSAELPVPEQEDKAVVSPAEEACKDCMDGHIQEAASQGQPRWLHSKRSLQRSGHAQAELLPGCWHGLRLGLLCATGLAISRRRLLSIILLPPLARGPQFLSGNSCLLHIHQSSGQQLCDGSFVRHAHTV